MTNNNKYITYRKCLLRTCRPQVFGDILTPINLNTNGTNSNRKSFQSELRENFLNNSQNTNKSQTFQTINARINKNVALKITSHNFVLDKQN
jgi:hypothetical protein